MQMLTDEQKQGRLTLLETAERGGWWLPFGAAEVLQVSGSGSDRQADLAAGRPHSGSTGETATNRDRKEAFQPTNALSIVGLAYGRKNPICSPQRHGDTKMIAVGLLDSELLLIGVWLVWTRGLLIQWRVPPRAVRPMHRGRTRCPRLLAARAGTCGCP